VPDVENRLAHEFGQPAGRRRPTWYRAGYDAYPRRRAARLALPAGAGETAAHAALAGIDEHGEVVG
jgi:hypothetical protein